MLNIQTDPVLDGIMDKNLQKTENPPTVMELWRKPGVDFDSGCKSTLAELLELGGYFPLCKVEDRLPFSRNSLQHWSRGDGDCPMANCFKPIRPKGQGRAITILVDLVRLNDLIAAQVEGRAPGLDEPTPGQRPHPIQESR